MIHFRTADETAIAPVAILLAALFEEVGHTPDAEDIAAIFEEIEADPRHSTLLALDDDDDIVGILTITESISIYAEGKIGVINELFVVPEYRSEGVGKMLLDEAKTLAENRGWRRLEVTTPGDDYPKTLHFYEREGFFRIGPRFKFEI